jgi:HD-like signal output (HDOD) protein
MSLSGNAVGTTAPPTSARTPLSVDELVGRLCDLPSQPTTALRVLWLADDPKCSARKLGDAVAADPALTTKALRLANSPYYGFSSRVSSAHFAVTILGTATIRSLAAMAASGLDSSHLVVPDWFWRHSAAAAAGCALLAPRFGVRPGDGFSLGLLHDLGIALFCQGDSEYASVRTEFGAALDEHERYGMDHGEAGAKVMAAWNFPAEFVEAVALHERGGSTFGLSQLLTAGDMLANLALEVAEDAVADAETVAQQLSASHEELDSWCDQVRNEADTVSQAMQQ